MGQAGAAAGASLLVRARVMYRELIFEHESDTQIVIDVTKTHTAARCRCSLATVLQLRQQRCGELTIGRDEVRVGEPARLDVAAARGQMRETRARLFLNPNLADGSVRSWQQGEAIADQDTTRKRRA